jgi:hypothetical protein
MVSLRALSVSVDIAAEDIHRQLATRLARMRHVFLVAPRKRSEFTGRLWRLDVWIVPWDQVSHAADLARATAIIGVARTAEQARHALSGGCIDVLFVPIADASLAAMLARVGRLVYGPEFDAAFEPDAAVIPQLGSVRWLKSLHAITTWHTTAGTYDSPPGLSHILEHITAAGFVRLRDSVFVNPPYVAHTAAGCGQRVTVTLDDGSEIRASERFKFSVRSRFSELSATTASPRESCHVFEKHGS